MWTSSALWAGLTLRTWYGRRCALWTLWACFTLRTLRTRSTCRTLRTGRTLWACRSGSDLDNTGRASYTYLDNVYTVGYGNLDNVSHGLRLS